MSNHNINRNWKLIPLVSKPKRVEITPSNCDIEVYAETTVKPDPSQTGYWVANRERLTMPINFAESLFVRSSNGVNGLVTVRELK